MQRWKRYAPLALAAVLAGCSESAAPLVSDELPVKAAAAARDDGREIFMAILEADGSRADSWNRIIILDQGRTDRQAEVRLYGTDGETWRYQVKRRGGSDWTIASREMLPALRAAMSMTSGDGPQIASIEGQGIPPSSLFFQEFPGEMIQLAGFAGNDADQAHWLLSDYETILLNDVVWEPEFLHWYVCQKVPNSNDYCKQYTTASANITFGTMNNGNIGAYRVYLHSYNDRQSEWAPLSVTISSGTSNVTTEGTYAWTASATGGWSDGTYSYSWQVSTDGGSSWTSACPGTGSTCTRTVLGGSGNFILRVVVTSRYSGAPSRTATSDTYPVTVNIPVTVSLTGPGLVTAKQVYSWTASTNVSNPTYDWYERSCTRWADETSCTGWVLWANGGSQFTRILLPDCSGTRQANFQVRVRVTRPSGGGFGEDNFTTALCIPPVE